MSPAEREYDLEAIVHEERARYWDRPLHLCDEREAHFIARRNRLIADALWEFLRGLRRGLHPLDAAARGWDRAMALSAQWGGATPDERAAWDRAVGNLLGCAAYDMQAQYASLIDMTGEAML